MSFLIGFKQLADMLYQFKILDFGMVAIAVLMICYAFFNDKVYQGFWKKTCVADYLVIALGVLYFFSFLRNTGARNQFIKTESAFLVYFLGRLYARRFVSAGKMDGISMQAETKFRKILRFFNSSSFIALCAYIVLYANLIARWTKIIIWLKTGSYVGSNTDLDIYADGGLYYYKTDLTLGTAMMVMLIYFFGKNVWLKWISIVPVAFLTAFPYSNGRSGQMILLLTYLMIAIWEIVRWAQVLKRRKRKETKAQKEEANNQKASNQEANNQPGNSKEKKYLRLVTIIFAAAVTVWVAFFIFLQCFPPLQKQFEDLGLSDDTYRRLEDLFHARHYVWWNAMSHFSKESFGTRLLGLDLESEKDWNIYGIRFHTTYLKQVYAIGYAGCLCYWVLLYRFAVAFVKSKRWMKPLMNGKMERKQADTDKNGIAPSDENNNAAEIVASDENNNVAEIAAENQSVEKVRRLWLLMWMMFMIMSFCMESFEYTQMSWLPFILSGMLVTMSMEKEDDCRIS